MRVFIVKTLFTLLILFSFDLCSQTVTLVNNLNFGNQVVGVANTVVVAPTDSGAAVFNATSMTPGKSVTCKIVNSSTTINNGGNGSKNNITVSNYTISGCTSVVPANGQILNIGVGATATITSGDLAGDYTGTNTFRITTN